jgi:DNA-binding NarL/FixJ family response regulator
MIPAMTQPVPEPCSVLIVEDDANFRAAFSAAIRKSGHLALLGAAGDLRGGRELLRQRPDVLLVDLQLPDGNGTELIREATRDNPDCDVMVVTVFGDERHVLQSIEAGATGYLLKDLPADELVREIGVLRSGGSPISPVIARQLLSRFALAGHLPAAGGDEQLSPQEVRVLTLTAKGYSYDEIAALMQLSRHTVQTYVKRMYRKLHVNSKLDAVAEARRRHLIHED